MEAKLEPKLTQRELKVGLKGVTSNVVEHSHLGGVNDVADPAGPVADCASTASIIGFIESAIYVAVQGFIPNGHGLTLTSCQVDHLSPTPQGLVITAEAQLTEVQGDRLTFGVTASDPFNKVGRGVVVAHLVNNAQ